MRELSVAEQRHQAVSAVISDGLSISHVGSKVGVSRETLHSRLARYEAEDLDGLVNRSHRPMSCPHQMPAAVEAALQPWLQTTQSPPTLLPMGSSVCSAQVVRLASLARPWLATIAMPMSSWVASSAAYRSTSPSCADKASRCSSVINPPLSRRIFFTLPRISPASPA